MSKKTIDILEKTIEEQEDKIAELEEVINTYERGKDFMVHRIINEKEKSKLYPSYDKLPLPRLEMQINPLRENWYYIEWIYGIVYKHYDDSLMFIPLGQTTANGDFSRLRNARTRISDSFNLPHRDGLHIRTEMKLFGLRGFVLCEGRIEEILDCEIVYNKELFEKSMKKMKRL
jgi:hypothetical protein